MRRELLAKRKAKAIVMLEGHFGCIEKQVKKACLKAFLAVKEKMYERSDPIQPQAIIEQNMLKAKSNFVMNALKGKITEFK